MLGSIIREIREWIFQRRQIALQEMEAETRKRKVDLDESAPSRNYRHDVASNAVVLFAAAKNAIYGMRSPIVSNDERKEAVRLRGEEAFHYPPYPDYLVSGSEKEKNKYIEQNKSVKIGMLFHVRMSKHNSTWDDLRELRPRFLAAFRTEEPFIEFECIIRDIKDASIVTDMILERRHPRGGRARENTTLYGFPNEDTIGPRIDKMMRLVHKHCHLVLNPEVEKTVRDLDI